MEVSHAEDPSQFIPMHWKRCEQLENEDLKLIFVMKSVAEENGGAFCAECLNPCFPFLTPEDHQKLCELAAEEKRLSVRYAISKTVSTLIGPPARCPSKSFRTIFANRRQVAVT